MVDGIVLNAVRGLSQTDCLILFVGTPSWDVHRSSAVWTERNNYAFFIYHKMRAHQQHYQKFSFERNMVTVTAENKVKNALSTSNNIKYYHIYLSDAGVLNHFYYNEHSHEKQVDAGMSQRHRSFKQVQDRFTSTCKSLFTYPLLREDLSIAERVLFAFISDCIYRDGLHCWQALPTHINTPWLYVCPPYWSWR